MTTIAQLRAAAAEVANDRAYLGKYPDPEAVWEYDEHVGRLLSLVAELPATAVLVDRAVLERVREALASLTEEACLHPDDPESCDVCAGKSALAALEGVLCG